jgi:microsomal prostaglandin-E synthase 2
MSYDSATMSIQTTLYQFTLCPFCNKVRAGLDLKGVSYNTIEVSPRTKVELPDLPAEAPRKVPVLRVDDRVLYDSTDILKALDEIFPDAPTLLPTDPQLRAEAERIEDWVDSEFIRALPTVIYGTWRSAARATRTISKASKFGIFEGIGVKMGGPMIMHMVAGRILKKAGRTDGMAWVGECLDQFETWLGDTDYVCGDTVTIADVAMYGGISCVRDFPIYESIAGRPQMAAWIARMADIHPSIQDAA